VTLEVQPDCVRMPAGNGRMKTEGRSVDVMRVIVRVKTALKFLAYALTAKARVLRKQITNHITKVEV